LAELAPLRSLWRLRYVDFQRETGESGAASETLAEITTKAPDYLPAWIALMSFAWTNRQTRACTDIIEQILLHDPDQALLARADLKITEGKVLEARIEFDRLRTSYLI